MTVDVLTRVTRSAAWRTRLLAIAAALLLAEAVWVVAELALGLRLQAPAGPGYPEPMDIGPFTVGLASAALALVGWGVLAVLERLTSRARRIWLVIALIALVASLGMPLSGTGVSAANRAVLVLMHLAVGGVLIPALYRSSRGRSAAVSRLASTIAHGRTA